jgi:SAM-dependent methyltransferase
MSQYDKIARYYDLDFVGFHSDVDFYRNYAGLYGAPVLDLGCGSGRISLPLAEDGLEVTGLDTSEAMLARARARLARHPELEDRLTFVNADMRDFELGRLFGVAIFAINTFMHLAEPEDRVRSLECVKRHLQPGGLLILDVQNPHQGLLTEDDGVLYHVYSRADENSDAIVSKFYARQLNRAQQLSHLTVFYDQLAPDGLLRRTVEQMTLRYWYPAELYAMLEQSGFQVQHAYGTYDLDELTAESPRLLFVAMA